MYFPFYTSRGYIIPNGLENQLLTKERNSYKHYITIKIDTSKKVVFSNEYVHYLRIFKGRPPIIGPLLI